ncbi:MAG TPA: HAD-IA family hydrolase [Candidatus Binatia bacterium]|nr:HAD-IA family hydrolase [Candidatus Binatia bacterium]
MLAAVIFDCDGVLFDSWRANVAYYNAVLRAMGRPPLDPAEQRHAHVMAASQVIDYLFRDDPNARERARRVAGELDYGPFYELMEPAPRLHETLGALKRSYRLAMATNRGRTVAEVVRRFNLDVHIDLAVGILDVPRPKPHPDMIEKCLAHFGVAPAAALYVGDAQSDLLAATAAGVHFVAVGNHFVAVGDHDWAPQRVEQLAELPHHIARLNDSNAGTAAR